MGIDPISAGLSAVGGIAGALGGGDAPGMAAAPTSGYATLPEEIQDYSLDVLFPRIQDVGEMPFPTVPLRRTSALDYDPLFGSTSRQYLQAMEDQKRFNELLPPTTPQAPAADEAGAVDALRNEMLARDFIRQMQKQNPRVQMQNFTSEDLATLGGTIGQVGLPYSQDYGSNFFAGLQTLDPEDRVAFTDLLQKGSRGF